MNRFRTKKKAKEAPDGLFRGSTESDGPPMPAIKTSKSFGFGKKHQIPEPKVELDVANALPSTDDFRTSLLMSGLSARFSMLREQDDPKSKIGKASDDSVLYPTKRQSRLADFGYSPHGLSDIAEVSSINGSIRPPFSLSRTDSYGTSTSGGDDDSLHGGSIMSRAKPGEGNNLFGGRQKIYKIPMNASGSSKNLADGTGSGMGGRALYEDDVHQSAFQKLREREREQQEQERDPEDAEQTVQYSRSGSPPPSNYNRNRETSSTTSSAGPSITRSSTAATSVTSQRTPSFSGQHNPNTPAARNSNGTGIERTATKTRRLYDTGLDQHLHEQQNSAVSRIDTLTRQRTFGAQSPTGALSSPTGLVTPIDRWGDRQHILVKSSMPNMRTASPSPTIPNANFDFGPRVNNAGERKQTFGVSSLPLSPPASESEDHAILAVEPNDRGKATALGTFSKPVQPYDDKKYTQRQLQMQQGRETPPPRAFPPRQQQMGRTRGDSNVTFASSRSRSNSSAQRQFLPQDRSQQPLASRAVVDDEAAVPSTFLSSPNSSSTDSSDSIEPETQVRHPVKPIDLYNKHRQDQNLPLARPDESEHPANRQRPFGMQDEESESGSPLITVSKPRLRIEESPARSTPTSTSPSDSPTLGPATGLSGMVRQHLRSDSNSSSIYGGMPSPSHAASRFPRDTMEPHSANEYSTQTNPWEVDDWDRQSDYDDRGFNLEDKMNGGIHDNFSSMPHSVRSLRPVTNQEASITPLDKDLQTHHKRDGSSETQKEQQDFKMDLAARRRRVQENLKSFVEIESRSGSPQLGGLEWPKEGHLRNNPLTVLKTKTSGGSLIGRPKEPGQSKAMKMLGIGSATMNSNSPSPGKSTFEEHLWKQEEEEMLRGINKSHTAPIIPPQTKAFRQARRDAQHNRERQVALRHQQRMAAEGNDQDWQKGQNEIRPRKEIGRVPPNIRTRQRTPSQERHPPPAMTRAARNEINDRERRESVATKSSGSRTPSRTSRDRSSSGASGRSKSRNGMYRDDSVKDTADGTSRSSTVVVNGLNPPAAPFHPRSPVSAGLPFSPSPSASPMIGAGSGPGPKMRSNSKSPSPAAGYFDGHNLQRFQTGTGIDIGLSPRPSPITPFSVNSTPSLPQPSPNGSDATTPTMQGFQNQTRIPGHRKRSVNKSEISEPKFISSTSRATLVHLPPGASLQNGAETAPPIPAVNPKRKTRAMFGFGKKEDQEVDYSLPAATQSTDEMSTFSADEGDSKPKIRQKLRKSSSEGGSLNVRARQAANAAPSPAVPAFPAGAGTAGGMF